jgi:hypothetical protein
MIIKVDITENGNLERDDDRRQSHEFYVETSKSRIELSELFEYCLHDLPKKYDSLYAEKIKNTNERLKKIFTEYKEGKYPLILTESYLKIGTPVPSPAPAQEDWSYIKMSRIGIKKLNSYPLN